MVIKIEIISVKFAPFTVKIVAVPGAISFGVMEAIPGIAVKDEEGEAEACVTFTPRLKLAVRDNPPAVPVTAMA